MYCPKCGTQNPDIAAFCSKCGTDLQRISNSGPSASYYNQPFNASDKAGIGWMILSFLLPIVGLILYFVWKSRFPHKAGQILAAAGVGFVINLILLAI
jgi:uncharacterized membrane protein YvbJ